MITTDSPFDKKLDLWGNRVPSNVRDSSTWLNDTLELCWASAQQIFGEKASPEQVFQIYDRLVSKIKDTPVEE